MLSIVGIYFVSITLSELTSYCVVWLHQERNDMFTTTSKPAKRGPWSGEDGLVARDPDL